MYFLTVLANWHKDCSGQMGLMSYGYRSYQLCKEMFRLIKNGETHLRLTASLWLSLSLQASVLCVVFCWWNLSETFSSVSHPFLMKVNLSNGLDITIDSLVCLNFGALKNGIKKLFSVIPAYKVGHEVYIRYQRIGKQHVNWIKANTHQYVLFFKNVFDVSCRQTSSNLVCKILNKIRFIGFVGTSKT